MTYGGIKNLSKALLTGDMALPTSDELVVALLEKAYIKIASKCNVLRLLTLNKDEGILRKGEGDYLVRFPELPTKDSDNLDMDHELCFAAASYIASFISKQSKQYHIEEAEEIITQYNLKVDKILKDVQYDNDEDNCYIG